jgi:hypothetical protein
MRGPREFGKLGWSTNRLGAPRRFHRRLFDELLSKRNVGGLLHLTLHSRFGDIEVFYNFAVTPAIRLIPSYQHIWHPLAAKVAKSQTRLTSAW